MYRYKQSHQVAQFLCVYICLIGFSLPILYQEHSNSTMINQGVLAACIIKTTHTLNDAIRDTWDQNMASSNLTAAQPRPYQLKFGLPLKIKFSIPF